MNEPEKQKEDLQAIDPVMEVGQMPLLNENQFEELEKRVEQQQRIRQIVLKTTKPHNWLVMGNKAYLDEMGCKVIASFLGLGLDIDEPVESHHKDEKGDYYSFTTKVTITFRGRSIDQFGDADSRDDFFTHGGKLPQSEVKRGNIKKKSITNALNRGIKTLLGLDFTRAEVEGVVGSLGGSSAVDYKSKPKEEMTADDVALKDNIKLKIWKMTGKDEQAFKDYLQKLTAWPEKDFKGHTDIDKLSAKVLKFKKKQVDEDYEKWEVTEEAG